MQKPIPNPAVVFQEGLGGWGVLVNPNTSDATDINPVGVVVWQLIEGQHSLEEIVVEVERLYVDVPGTVDEDVRAFVRNLAEGGFVEYGVEGDSL